jgi:hypothetical protein
MTPFDTFTRQGGKATASGLVFKVVVIFAVGAVTVLLATSVARTGDHLAKLPVTSVYAKDPDSTPKPLPSSAQAKSWDPVQYAPDDFDPMPGQIED